MKFITSGRRPQVINSIFSRVITSTTCDIFQYFSPAIWESLSTLFCKVFITLKYTSMYFCDVVLKPDHDEQWPSFLRFRISRRYRLCYKGHKEKGHLMKNMVFPKLGTEEYRKLYCCYTNPVYTVQLHYPQQTTTTTQLYVYFYHK